MKRDFSKEQKALQQHVHRCLVERVLGLPGDVHIDKDRAS